MSAQFHLISDSPASYADLETLPPNYVAEIIGGRLHAQPRPQFRHARAASRLVSLIGMPFDLGEGGGPGGWIILEEPELHVVRNIEVLVPDLAGWKAERLSGMNPDEHRFEITPDWVCEILSPSTQRYDREDKLPIYRTWGVPWVWLIDPERQNIEVLRLTGTGDSVDVDAPASASPTANLPPFEAIELPIERLWH